MEWYIDIDLAGQRLDLGLAAYTGLTRARVQGLIEKGLVTVNGQKPLKNGQALKNGDCVCYELPQVQHVCANAQALPLEVVYEDGDVIVINKARGMVVHPAAGHPDGTLVNALLAHCTDLSGIGGQLRPGIVHRLDKETTGLMVCAKNDRAHLLLSEQLKARTVKRRYAAVAAGHFKQDFFTVDAPIGRHKTDRKRMDVTPEGRAAKTDFTVLETYAGASLLKCALYTGRTHQIRVHLRHLGHPILGDEIYGPGKPQSPVLMLHAFRLSFEDPATGALLSFVAAPPQDFIAGLTKCGWSQTPFWQLEQ